MPRISVSGKRSARIRIIPAELIKADGTVDRTSATQDGVRPAWWQYTLGKDGTVSWFPKFFYQGARYLQVECFPAEGDTALPELKDIEGTVVHGSADSVGSFACSNELFNQIYRLVRWAQRSNMMTVLTDCPQREKMPWLEQYHLNGPSLRYNFDLTTLFRKAMNDMADAQLKNGFVPNIAPEYFHAGADWKQNGLRNSPEWGSAFIIVPWQQYLFSGDISMIRRYYDKMKFYLAFLDSTSKDNLLTTGLGDWYDIGPKPAWGSQLTPVAFTGTAIYYYDYEIMTKIARILNRKTDVEKFELKRQTIKDAFNKAFYNDKTGLYATGSNTTCAMPVFFGLAAPEQRKHLMDALADSIRRRNNSFTSGEVGYRFLLRSLADNGYSNVVYAMNNQTNRPGYGYQIKHGATSLTEKWDGSVGSFGSQNHFMSGQINEWFFHDLAGISDDESGPGFRKIVIKPAIIGDLTWVKGSFHSISGLIKTEWKRDNDQLSVDIVVPANTSATVYLPVHDKYIVLERGKLVETANGIKQLTSENNCAVFVIGSGTYHFLVKSTGP
jgi:alpha-L-rhamnosidase